MPTAAGIREGLLLPRGLGNSPEGRQALLEMDELRAGTSACDAERQVRDTRITYKLMNPVRGSEAVRNFCD